MLRSYWPAPRLLKAKTWATKPTASMRAAVRAMRYQRCRSSTFSRRSAVKNITIPGTSSTASIIKVAVLSGSMPAISEAPTRVSTPGSG